MTSDIQNNQHLPIGIFDSGIGGLTVAKAVKAALPKEDILYFGDTARVPYGVKSEETVHIFKLVMSLKWNSGVQFVLKLRAGVEQYGRSMFGNFGKGGGQHN